MDDLKSRWAVFAGILFDPWTLLLLIFTGVLMVASVYQDNPAASALALLLVTVASAVLGGRVTQHWTKLNDAGVLQTKGKSAVGSLKLLLGGIYSLEKRVSKFLASAKEGSNPDPVGVRNLEEIMEVCNRLQEETVHSIEDWTDIVPEADIKTQIGVISELKSEVDAKADERDQLVRQLESTKAESTQMRDSLRKQIAGANAELAKLKRELVEKEANVSSSIPLLTTTTTPGVLASVFGNPFAIAEMESRGALPSMEAARRAALANLLSKKSSNKDDKD